ncbi:hypothetical protein [Photobacterium sanguinicancri]|uniref:Uncharacterized protein n=1 Tax=Photobacterium sanguinicancri TaxID=875932 RepID=A0AAW7YD94_9GAMM|nr:hypothetical protein [Photobacterium sanguinicancri]MDO6545519.1 hypothetical protein [Photobacterium sanguinicancri]
MSIFSDFLSNKWEKVKSVGKALLKSFNPFLDNEYKNSSLEDRGRFESEIQRVANDNTLDHEYRMEAKRALVKIESFRHAEELARIEGTTKITIAHIEATRDVVLAKIDILKTNIVGCRKKEVALIDAIGQSPELVDKFLNILDSTSLEIKESESNLTTYSHELTTLINISKSNARGIQLLPEPSTATKKKRTRVRTRAKRTVV